MGAPVITPDNPLTEEERQFAEKRHGLIYKFLRHFRLSDDYYDVVVFGYLRAVRNYLKDPKLKKYSFSTIAFRCMFNNFDHHRNREKRKLHTRAMSLDYEPDGSYSLNEKIEDKSIRFFDDYQPTSPENLLYQYIYLLTEKQHEVLMLHASGYTYPEIGEIIGLTAESVSSTAKCGKRKVRRAAEKHEKTAHAAGTA